MPKNEKVRVSIKEKVEDNLCDLSLCQLSEVPVREILHYKRVTILDLSSNKLFTLGKNFHTLTRLVKLNLSKNQIKHLPEEFGMLCNLRYLDLYDNALEYLPLSFSNLSNLRYLDLKDNPLLPALAKIVGFCMTAKECHNCARSTVKFLSQMQAEMVKDQERLEEQKSSIEPLLQIMANSDSMGELQSNDQRKKYKSKKNKAKAKKLNSNNADNLILLATKASNNAGKANSKAKKHLSNVAKKANGRGDTVAFKSICLFVLLLCLNVFLIYGIMFKNPHIIENLVAFIPYQYRHWLMTKTEMFRLRVTDWIAEFRTAPEEQ